MAQTAQYRVVNLGQPSAANSAAYRINNAGQVVGVSYADWQSLSALLWQDTTVTVLGSGVAFGINDAGQVVGRHHGVGFDAFLWDGGNMTFLGTLGGNDSDARAINNLVQIAGNARDSTNRIRAFKWDSGGMTQLYAFEAQCDVGAPPPACGWSSAEDINDHGQAVGGAWNVDGQRRAILWDGGGMTELGTLGGENSSAVAINNLGQIVGLADVTHDGHYHAFLWANGALKDLGTLGGLVSIARGINDLGQVVGGAQPPEGPLAAFLWQDGTMINLNDHIDPGSGWHLLIAYDINDKGWIVGEGLYEGKSTAFLLMPSCLVVTALSDEPDADAGDGVCDTGSGDCSLRAAIEEANALPGKQCITFDILDGGGGPVVDPVINPFSALPAITDSLSIDGTTQPGSDRVRIAGLAAGSGADGLVIEQAHAVSLKGLAFYDFDGTGIAIIGGSDHLIEDTFVGWNGSSPRPNGAAGIHVSGGATDITIGSLEEDLINHIADGIRIEGDQTRKIKVLKNALEVPADWINGEGVRLPIDLGDEGPMCATWDGPAEGAPNDAMPSPRVLELTPVLVRGMTEPGATVIIYEVHDRGTGLSRYWPRLIDPIAHGEAGGDGMFTIALELEEGARVTLVAVDTQGNTSEPTQLRRPVIFLPGIGGTWLRSAENADLWLPLVLTSDGRNERMRRLAMLPDGTTSVETIVADEVLEQVSVPGYSHRTVYGPIHDHLQAAGFAGHPFNLNPSTLDQWRFPHDWRRSVAVLANDLRILVNTLTTDSGDNGGAARSCQVDLVGHSNGGMISSVYLRRDADHAADRIHRFVTSGTPYLGSTQAVAAHANGYIFGVDEEAIGIGWDVAWGDMVAMTRNVAGAYGLMPSRAYYDALGTSSTALLVDLYNEPVTGYDKTFDFMTDPKEDPDALWPRGLARNVDVWAGQQSNVHNVMNDWRQYDGPPQIFRQVGILPAQTEVGWFLGPGPQLIPEHLTTRSEPGDTDRHRAYRERLWETMGLGDKTVPLVSATLGRYPGELDLSGVLNSDWIEEFEYYECDHGGLVLEECRLFGTTGLEALERVVEILESGHRVPASSTLRTAAGVSRAGDAVAAEIFYTLATAPVRVVIEDAEGRQTGSTQEDVAGAIEHSIPGIHYRASLLGATFSLLADSAYTVTVISEDPDALIYLTRQRVGLESSVQILYADQALPDGGTLTFSLSEGGTPESTSWQLDADGDGTPEADIFPAVILPGTSAALALPFPQPSAFEVGVAVEGTTSRVLRLPDTGTQGWSYQLEGGAPWLSLSAMAGNAPAEIELEFDAEGLPEGPTSTSLALTLTNEGYETTLDVPITLHVGVTVDSEPGGPEGAPARLVLQAPYPNPTQGRAFVRYGLPTEVHVRLEVFDVLGRRIALVTDERHGAGWHEAVMDASRLPVGVYVVRLQAGEHVQARRLTVVR